MPTATTQEKVCVTHDAIATHDNIVCSISGGSDSDCMLRVVWECDEKNKVKYFFVDTGLEMQATKDHIKYLEKLYGIHIETIRPKVPCAVSVKRNGYPCFDKKTAEYIHRLQRNGFDFTEANPNPENMIKTGYKFWTNSFAEGEHKPLQGEVGSKRLLKEYMMNNPPQIHISAHCCDDCKKEPLHRAEKGSDLVLTGIRKAEGGVRSVAYKNCFVENYRGQYDLHMPLFWWTDKDKKAFEETFGIVHSRAYTEYGLKRTGCAGCPFNSNFDEELTILDYYEPELSRGVKTIFKPAYEYIRAYKEFRDCRKPEAKKDDIFYDADQITIEMIMRGEV